MHITRLVRTGLSALATAAVVVAFTGASQVPCLAAGTVSQSSQLHQAGPNWDHRAVAALMDLYDADTGLWRGTGWWNSANALTSLLDYMRLSHDHRYLWVVANTFDRAQSAHGGDFTNSFADDTGWWALAWIR